MGLAWPTTVELDGVLYCHATPCDDERSSRRHSSDERFDASPRRRSRPPRRRRPHAHPVPPRTMRQRRFGRHAVRRRRRRILGGHRRRMSSSAAPRSTSSAPLATSARPTGRSPTSSSARTFARRRRAPMRSSITKLVSDRVAVGRVGKPHGIAGAFYVEEPSDDPERFGVGAELFVGGAEAKVVESKRAQGRPVIRLDRDAPRGAVARGRTRPRCRRRRRTSTTSSSSSAWTSSARTASRSGASTNVAPGVANDVLELDSGLLLPLVEACVRQVDLEAAQNRCRTRLRRGRLTWSQSCSSTSSHSIPHAFAWLTEQRPVATVLGERARSAPVRLPRHDAASRRPGRRRAVRRRRRDGPSRRRRRRRTRRRRTAGRRSTA